MKTREDLFKLFSEAEESRRTLIAELNTLAPQARRERLQSEHILVQAVVGTWQNPSASGSWSNVGRDKAEKKALDKQLRKIHSASGEAAKRWYGYADSRPTTSDDPWTEIVNDLFSELEGVPPTVVTHEFNLALHSYR